MVPVIFSESGMFILSRLNFFPSFELFKVPLSLLFPYSPISTKLKQYSRCIIARGGGGGGRNKQGVGENLATFNKWRGGEGRNKGGG